MDSMTVKGWVHVGFPDPVQSIKTNLFSILVELNCIANKDIFQLIPGSNALSAAL